MHGKSTTPHVPTQPGDRYGRWIVLSLAEPRRRKDGNPAKFWLCRCDCGTEREVRQTLLRNGQSRSCGCFHNEQAAAHIANVQRSHGMADTPEYTIWHLMHQRCRDPARRNYGERGITVCERWSDFANFYADMGTRPSADHSIDRINVNGNYEPGNCRWATKKEQSRNQRKNRLLTFQGETLCLAEWCERFGIPKGRLETRLALGWDVERALTAPTRSRR